MIPHYFNTPSVSSSPFTPLPDSRETGPQIFLGSKENTSPRDKNTPLCKVCDEKITTDENESSSQLTPLQAIENRSSSSHSDKKAISETVLSGPSLDPSETVSLSPVFSPQPPLPRPNISSCYRKMMLDFSKIPNLLESRTVYDSQIIILGDLHANTELFIHQLVQTGYLEPKNPDTFAKDFKFFIRTINLFCLHFSSDERDHFSELHKELSNHDFSENTRKIIQKKADKIAREIAWKTAGKMTQQEVKKAAYEKALEEVHKDAHEDMKILCRQALSPFLNKSEKEKIILMTDFFYCFQEKLDELFEAPKEAQTCELVCIGDILGDRRHNDFFSLELFRFLERKEINFTVIASNHDMEFLSWYHNGMCLEGAPLKLADPLCAMSLLRLDVLCQDKYAGRWFQERVERLVKKTYLPHLKLFACYDLSREEGVFQDIMVTHAPVTKALINHVFSGIFPDEEGDAPYSNSIQINSMYHLFDKLKWSAKDFLDLYGETSFSDFFWYRGPTNKSDFVDDLTPPDDALAVVHGHDENISTHGCDNPELPKQYLSLDGYFGKDPNEIWGLRRYFALPK